MEPTIVNVKPPPLPPRPSTYRASSHSSLSSTPSQGPPLYNHQQSHTLYLVPHGRSRSASPNRDDGSSNGSLPAYTETWGGGDPRSSSMHSLRPIGSAEGSSRRTLLLIYIHGFMGNETSFRSFPAHVHNLLTVTLAETHVVHTKIYPRYKSRRSMDIARDNFSNWLVPNESAATDIILLGHSIGGILAAEVALLRAYSPRSPEIRQHRILGIVAFDTPFLGMHPGVVSTGLASLFRTKTDISQEWTTDENRLTPHASNIGSDTSPTSSTTSDPFEAQPSDPNYNPSFANDIILKNQKCWRSTLHFINKYQNGLTKATKDYVTSYFEFGGCLADYPGLKNRYTRIRELEDVDEFAHRKDESGRPVHRVRFVNYYTASTGRPNRPKEDKGSERSVEIEMRDMSLNSTRSRGRPMQRTVPPAIGPRLSLEEYTDDEVIPKILDEIDPTPMEDEDHNDSNQVGAHLATQIGANVSEEQGTQTTELSSKTQASATRSDPQYEDDILPPTPDLPDPPADFDPSKYGTQGTLKLAQKEHTRQVKAYERAKKDREKTIRDREKTVAKREKATRKQEEKEAKILKKQQDFERKERLKRQVTVNPEAYDKHLESGAEEVRAREQQMSRKKTRDRKFCALPSKDAETGERDKTWIRVYMEGVDEVVAHTALFCPGETYEKLVGDTAGRVEEWVKEDASTRMVLQQTEEGADWPSGDER